MSVTAQATAPGRSRVGVVIGALFLVMLLAALDQTIVATALPTIVGDLGGLEHISWVVTAYLLAQTVVTPLYGKLGDLYYFDSVRVNLGLFQHDVDVLWDLAPHDLAILTHLIPETPTHVQAVGADHFGNGLADVAYMTCWYASGLIAHFHVNWLSPVKVRRILVGGSRRMLVYDDLEPSEKVRIYDRGVTAHAGVYETLVDYRVGDMVAPKLDFTEALAVEAAHFVACIRDGARPISGGPEGVAVVRLLEAASRSLRAGGDRIAL